MYLKKKVTHLKNPNVKRRKNEETEETEETKNEIKKE